MNLLYYKLHFKIRLGFALLLGLASEKNSFSLGKTLITGNCALKCKIMLKNRLHKPFMKENGP